MSIKRTAVAGLVLGGLVAGTGIAVADTPAGVADIGGASFTKGGTAVSVPALASCSVDGPASGSTGLVAKPGITFGSGTSSCTTQVTDPANDITTTTSTATGKNFELSALVSVGGKRIRLASYSVTCTGTQSHTNANWTLSGITGLPTLPPQVPPNYSTPLTKADGTVLATAVFNGQSLPGDGSMELTALQINFAPASGISGSVTIGHTACSPTP